MPRLSDRFPENFPVSRRVGLSPTSGTPGLGPPPSDICGAGDGRRRPDVRRTRRQASSHGEAVRLAQAVAVGFRATSLQDVSLGQVHQWTGVSAARVLNAVASGGRLQRTANLRLDGLLERGDRPLSGDEHDLLVQPEHFQPAKAAGRGHRLQTRLDRRRPSDVCAACSNRWNGKTGCTGEWQPLRRLTSHPAE